MKISTVVLLLIGLPGCALTHKHGPLLGAQVHTFTVGSKTFTHCSILVDHDKPQLVHDALEVCRDEIQMPITMPNPAAR